MSRLHQYAAAQQLARQLAETRAFVEARLRFIGPHDKIRLVHFEPEPLVALGGRSGCGF